MNMQDIKLILIIMYLVIGLIMAICYFVETNKHNKTKTQLKEIEKQNNALIEILENQEVKNKENTIYL